MFRKYSRSFTLSLLNSPTGINLGGRRRLSRHRLWRWFHLESFSQGNERLMALHLGIQGVSRKSCTFISATTFVLVLHYPSFLPYAYNAEITRKNSAMTVMWYQVVNLQMCAFIRISDSYERLPRLRRIRNRRLIRVLLMLHGISCSKIDN